MRRRTARGGVALPAALAALAVSLALAAALADIARTELTIAAQRRTATTALAALDTCLARVIATLPSGWDFAAIVDGPDGLRGTADDGGLVTPPGCTGRGRPAPGPPGPARMLVALDASSGDGRRLLDAVVTRSAAPMLPALFWMAALPGTETLSGRITADGGGDPGDDLPALAAPDAPEVLDAWMAEAHLETTSNTALPVTATAPPLGEILARLRAAATSGAAALEPDPGAPPAPSLMLVEGDLVVPDARQGAGILFVGGRLDIRTALTFTGLVIAVGGVRVTNGATLAVAGGVWIGPSGPAGAPLDVAGTLAVRRDTAAIDAADALFALPRRAVPGGLRDAG